MVDRFRHVVTFVREHPWAILPSSLESIVEIVGRHQAGERLTEAEIASRIEGATPARGERRAGTIVVLPIMGVIAHRASMVEDVSGPRGTSTEKVGRAFQAAVADPHVDGIVLDIHSPGGSVFGVEELANLIHGATKPVLAHANAMAASAAYWLGSQAAEFTVTPSGEVGSIGVLTVHEDISKRADQEGVKVSYVSAGQYKTEGNPFEPLGDEARQHLQSRVDAYHDTFVRAVARGRAVSQKDVRQNFGRGRLLGAEQALSLGMVDRVESFDAALERFARKLARTGSGSKAAEVVELDTTAAAMSPAVAAAEAEVLEPAREDSNTQADLDLRRRRLRLAAATRG